MPESRSQPSEALRAMIVAEARGWVGTPWRHQGCAKGRAADCVGLIKGVARGLGLACGRVDAEAYRGYPRLPNPKTLLAGLDEHMLRVPSGAARPGDVLLIRIDGRPQHLAFLSGGDMIVHAFAQARKVVEQRMPPAWKREVVRAYAYPEVR